MSIRVSSGRGSRALPAAGGGGGSGRLIMAAVMVVVALISYFGSRTFNPYTGEDQFVSITPEQEIALGLQAVPELESQFGGESNNQEAQQLVDEVGQRLVQSSVAQETGYPYEFTLLADSETINAFALPGGQVFITEALLSRLETEGQLAGILGHEIGHVVARHGAQRIAQQELAQGLTGAFVLATYDPENPSSQNAAYIAQMVNSLITMKYGREDELQSDSIGVDIMADAGYDPRALIQVMEILEEASGGNRSPEFLSTHPNPGNRVATIEEEIAEVFPNGVPEGLIP
jgi:beta-barrel assembly-enhancing protease